jgi:selenocysteine-specific elongation factor
MYHEPMRHVVWGTAGHIDHGKTTLIRALTGIDCDRLPEEQERGITIDLGFAQMTIDDLQLHFVDVPGHERLVHNMIAGAAGIDRAVLVVAADEGLMPQTREHLEVIRLMGVAGGAVVVTKIDLVDSELAEMVTEEVTEYLAATPFADVPVVPVSTHTGAGLERLRSVLVEQSRAVRSRQIDGRPFRQAVDRVFSLTGAGTVVTGTSLWGSLEIGSEVVVQPRDVTARVRRLHVHGEECDRVEAGERVALNLAGVSRADLSRGDQLLSPGPWQPTRMVTVRLELLASAPGALDEGDEVELHSLAARVSARIERLAHRPLDPGRTAVAQIQLREPMMLFPGDRLVLRRPSPVNTFAGGKVLDACLERWRRRDSALLDELPDVQRSAWPRLIGSWIERAGIAGMTAAEVAARLGVFPEAVEAPVGRLLGEASVRSLPTRPPVIVSCQAMGELKAAAAQQLATRLAGQEVSAGIPSRDFTNRLLPKPARRLAEIYLEELRAEGVIELADGRVVPPGTDSHMTAAGKELSRRVEALYREAGFEAPSPAEAAELLDARPASVEGICRFLTQRRRLVRLDGRFLVHRAVLDELAADLRDSGVEDLTVGDFKKRYGLTRKLAIPALEWLDSERVTVRHGDRRRVIRRTG